MNPTRNHEVSGSIPGLAHSVTHSGYRSGIAVSCGIGHRCGSDQALLWLWRRLVATSLIIPLAWELPYAMGAVLKRQKRTKKKEEVKFGFGNLDKKDPQNHIDSGSWILVRISSHLSKTRSVRPLMNFSVNFMSLLASLLTFPEPLRTYKITDDHANYSSWDDYF